MGASSKAPRSRSRAASGSRRTSAHYLAPATPSKIIAVHLTYRSRVEEYAARIPPQPSYFMKPPTTLNGHRGAIRRPAGTRFLNYEGELAVVIGRRDEGRRRGRGARPRRRLRVRQRRRPARLPPRRPRLDAARQGPGRLPAARPRARPRGRVRPHRLHPAHVPQRRGRAGGARERPALRRRLPARRPVAADHARARRRGPHRHAGELAARWSRATSSRSRSTASAG